MALRHAVLVAALALSTLAPTLGAQQQCPDGSVRLNCSATQPARPTPPLDDRTWIVLPFENVTRATADDWLSNASVSLLYIDMSRWTDIHVVDDARVTDLLRDVAEARRTQLGLAAAISIAKLAGAGRLVTGSLLRAGTRLTLTARVYNTRTSAPLRTVIDTLPNMDALANTFSRLAAKVLAVPPPPGTALAGIGTQSAEAVRAFTLGQRALQLHRLDSALVYFRRAVGLDSTFALAHLGLARTLVFFPGGEAGLEFAAASRHASLLPERERLIVALGQRPVDRGTACSLGSRLLDLDSAAAQGWVAVSECSFGNDRLLVDPAGAIRAEGNWNTARNAAERAVRPEERGGFQTLMVLYAAEERLGCTASVGFAQCPIDSLYVAASLLEGDTIVHRFERWRDARFDPPARRSRSQTGLLAMRVAARDLAARWTATVPNTTIDRAWYGVILLKLGDFAGAEREFAASVELGKGGDPFNIAVYQGLRLALELRREQPTRAAQLVDSILYGVPRRPANGAYLTALGQFSRDIAATANASTSDTAPAVRPLRAAFNIAFSGVVAADFEQTVRRFADARAERAVPARRDAMRQEILDLGTVLGFHTLRTGPALDTASAFPLIRYQAYFARGDTARARRALAAYDAWGAAGRDDQFDGHEMFAAESYLELGDTTAAWQRIERFGRLWSGYVIAQYGGITSDFWGRAIAFELLHSTRVIGRAWLLYADLAMATGHANEARRGYKMVVGLWERGEAPVQPLVTRAKEALAKLGG